MSTLGWLKEKKLIVWGCGKIGKVFAKYAKELNIPISYFVDSNDNQNSLSVDGVQYTVSNPNVLCAEMSGDFHILVAVKENEDIICRIKSWGIDKTQFNDWSSIRSVILDSLYKKRFPTPSDVPVFKQVEIETINRCNHDCPFCPGNKYHDKRKLKIMDEKLFEKILYDLKTMGFNGNIGLFGTNEPLLDPYITQRLKRVKDMLPRCFHFFSTNGTLLTLGLFKKIIPNVDDFIVDNYSDDKELLPNLADIVEYIDFHHELKMKTRILMRLKNEVLTSRGGLSPNKQTVIAPPITCSMPFDFLNIKSNGIVSLCCSDYFPQYNMGDLNKQSILDVWNGEKFTDVRNVLMEQGRPSLELCNRCDAFFVVRH